MIIMNISRDLRCLKTFCSPSIYSDTKAKVIIRDGKTDIFNVKEGVLQGAQRPFNCLSWLLTKFSDRLLIGGIRAGISPHTQEKQQCRPVAYDISLILGEIS